MRRRPPEYSCVLEQLIRCNPPSEVIGLNLADRKFENKSFDGPVLDLSSFPVELLRPESKMGWVRTEHGWRIKD